MVRDEWIRTMSDWIDEARRRREIEAIPKYGVINPRTDTRCFIKEATDELLDALNYAEWAMMKGEIPFCDWVLIDENIRAATTLLKGFIQAQDGHRANKQY